MMTMIALLGATKTWALELYAGIVGYNFRCPAESYFLAPYTALCVARPNGMHPTLPAKKTHKGCGTSRTFDTSRTIRELHFRTPLNAIFARCYPSVTYLLCNVTPDEDTAVGS